MESSQFVRATLANRTNADCSNKEAKNSRWHYWLKFEQSIGFDWLEKQIHKTSSELDVTVELWEIHPSGVNSFDIEVREVQRRENIDDSQHDLTDFDQND